MGQAELQAIHDTLIDAGFRPAAPTLVEIIKCISRYRFDVKELTLTNNCTLITHYISNSNSCMSYTNNSLVVSLGAVGSNSSSATFELGQLDVTNLSFIFISVTHSNATTEVSPFIKSLDTGVEKRYTVNPDKVPNNTYVFDLRELTSIYIIRISVNGASWGSANATIHRVAYF